VTGPGFAKPGYANPGFANPDAIGGEGKGVEQHRRVYVREGEYQRTVLLKVDEEEAGNPSPAIIVKLHKKIVRCHGNNHDHIASHEALQGILLP
jgi:hypothetical protein